MFARIPLALFGMKFIVIASSWNAVRVMVSVKREFTLVIAIRDFYVWLLFWAHVFFNVFFVTCIPVYS